MAKTPPTIHIPPGRPIQAVKLINPVNFGPAILKRFMAPPLPGLETFKSIPSFSFLLEHESGKLLVFDLGIREDYQNYSSTIKHYIPTTGYDIQVNKNVAGILLDHGISLESVEAVIWSHWHWDHIGDPSTFPASADLVVGPGFKKEMLPGAPSNPQSPIQESDYIGRNLREISFERPNSLMIGRFPAFDYFGDGSFYLLDSPGHAVGHLCGLARTTTGPDTFVLLGGDICHYAGIFRPSKYLPIPQSISPHPCHPQSHVPLCPGDSFERLQRSRGRLSTDSVFDLTFGHDLSLARETTAQLQELDCDENIFVIVAHDATVRDSAPHFPLSLNDWKAQGLGKGLKWAFLQDLESYWKVGGNASNKLDYDVLIIGAGLSGILSLYRMREIGVRTLVIEAGSAEGGTWFWNRYPGARFDSESYSYIFSFSQEVLDEWSWTEHFASQPETLRYIQYLSKKFDLKRDIQFNTRVKSARFQEETSSWLVEDAEGHSYTSRFLVTAMGILNEPTLPNIPGVENFMGESWHTARWPENSSSLKGKRVGIVGTGATAIQTIQAIAGEVGHLTVFQRNPNWAAPLRNRAITPEEMNEIRQSYPEIFRKCYESYAGFIHMSDTRTVFSMTEEERQSVWERLYAEPGFAKVLSISPDIFTDRKANDLYSKFHADKIRSRVNDPEVAETLIPKNHGFGTRRVPLESGYFEVFNQPNVKLVDLKKDPIVQITETCVQTGHELHELDVLIYATGFDAVTGSFRAVDFQGRDGIKLKDVWEDGIRTFLGLTVKDFPNMFMVMGPHQMFGNFPRSIEYSANWVADIIRHAHENNITRIEATEKGMDEWTAHVHECGQGLLANEVDSWMTGVNNNLAHKQKRSMTRYNGPGPGYRKRCDEVKQRGYTDFILTFA
ncbi:Phenylacetone monooxygenase [Paramyrothecium foliicola]|nr:Phenylacetone monooxygenase [Paramyrothecium foliicola]